MSLKKKILDKVESIVQEKFEPEEVTYVPQIDNPKLTFGNTGLLFEATVLFIDMRGSTKVLNSHYKSSVAKIHKAYFYTIVKIAKKHGGEIRSFNGDSMLVFFQGTTKDILNNAVQAAMQMKYMFESASPSVNDKIKKYSSIDFGIGIDNGKILCSKIGMSSAYDNKDLVWIGNAVNKSTRLGDTAKHPNNIVISDRIYKYLSDNTKYHDKTKNNMWKKTTFFYNGNKENAYYTNIGWVLN